MEKTSVIAYTREGKRWIPAIRTQYYTINVNNVLSFDVLLTPSLLKEYVMGRLVSNAYVEDPDSIERINIRDDIIEVEVTPDFEFRMEYLRERGVEPLETINIPRVNGSFFVDEEKLMEKLTLAGDTFFELPSYLLSDINGYIFTASDIEDENAFYKAVGRALKDRFDLKNAFLVSSSIIRPETVIRASYLGIPLLGTTKGITDLAASVGEELGITLFQLDLDGLKVFTHPSRIR